MRANLQNNIQLDEQQKMPFKQKHLDSKEALSTSSTFNGKDANSDSLVKTSHCNSMTEQPSSFKVASAYKTANTDQLKHEECEDQELEATKVSEPGKTINVNRLEKEIQSLSKKPNFSVVCMLPRCVINGLINFNYSKDKKILGKAIGSSKDRTHQLIEPDTLKKILTLQSQHQKQRNFQSSKEIKPFINMDKTGLCGTPSLWMTHEELIKENHISKDVLLERERISNLHSVLKSHKKWENEKYFGGNNVFKRTLGGSNVITITTNNQTNSDFITFSSEVLKARIKAQKEEKQNQINNKDDNEQVFPSIKSFNQSEQFTFKILQAEAKLVRMILEAHGFQHTESNEWNLLWTCNSTQNKPYMYENLNECQKINHFINSTELTRKDRYCFNVSKMEQKYGKQHFDFAPETYILPDEFADLYKVFNQRQKDGEKNMWIIKPSQSSQGKGIFMVDDLQEIPLNESMVISRYIDNPLLINGLKFDLRIYVLVTSFDPLKIYIYNEGLVRFASEAYNNQTIKSNVYAHLTNYSINKKNDQFIQNQNLIERDFGNKWSLSALQIHLQKLGVNMSLVWERIYDSVIKSLISMENHVFQAMKKVQNINNSSSRSNSFDIFGFDILLDSDLKPWILEVNLSPSLAFDSPLDFHIKSNLIIDALNIVGFKKSTKKKEALGKQLKPKPVVDKSASTQQQTNSENRRRFQSALNVSQANLHANNQNKDSNIKPGNLDQAISKTLNQGAENLPNFDKLTKISAKHREQLREHFQEFERNQKNNFTRIFPAHGTNQYDQYFEQPRSLNKLLYKYLYQSNELSQIVSILGKQKEKEDSQAALEDKIKDFDYNSTANVQDKGNNEYINQNEIVRAMNMTEKPSDVGQAAFFRTEKQQARCSSMSYVGSNATLAKFEEMDENEKFLKGTTTEQKPRKLSKIMMDELSSHHLPQTAELPKNQKKLETEEKVVITGDDILIEYVKRAMEVVKKSQNVVSSALTRQIQQFLNHKVWYNKAGTSNSSKQLWEQIETKYIEMQERKHRIHLKKHQDQYNLSQIEKSYQRLEQQKDNIIQDFSSEDLEQMLYQSNKNNQIEVVEILISGSSGSYSNGLLTKLEREYVRASRSSQQMMKLLKISTESSDSKGLKLFSQQDKNFHTPKDNQYNSTQFNSSQKQADTTFNYNTQQPLGMDQMSNSYHQSKTSLHQIKNSVLYQQTQQYTQQSTMKSQKKNISDRDFSLKQAPFGDTKKVILPQIGNQQLNHLSQDYSKVSIQLNSANEGEKFHKFRQRGEVQGKKVRGQSLSTDHQVKQHKLASNNLLKSNTEKSDMNSRIYEQ